jgi:hypothetical protein
VDKWKITILISKFGCLKIVRKVRTRRGPACPPHPALKHSPCTAMLPHDLPPTSTAHSRLMPRSCWPRALPYPMPPLSLPSRRGEIMFRHSLPAPIPLCSSSHAERAPLLLTATVDEPCHRASSARSSCAAGATPSSSTGRLRRVGKAVAPGRVSEAAATSTGAPPSSGISGHGTAPPTPPQAQPVLRTSLQVPSRPPPPLDDALHAVPLQPTTHCSGARPPRHTRGRRH